MTAKRKAEELTHKFYEIENDSQYFGVNWKIAKQCAIIAVDEVLNTKTLKVRSCGFVKLCEQHKEYWQEVKQEIEKL
jgi:hypothetical protein